MSRAARWVVPLAAALCLGPAFWLAALRGSTVPTTLALPMNVHGLPAPGYDGHTSRPLAPLSARIIADARQDAASPPAAGPALSGTTAAPTPTPPSNAASPTSPAVPVPSPTAIPIPTASALPLPTPTPLPLPTPTPLPLPSPTALPLPTPTPLPLPTPSGLPLPTL